MISQILICDDSSFARKQMARALPDAWGAQLVYAANGQEALEMIRAGKAELLFLDLNMPVLDGYQTLAAIRSEDLPVMTIVVSGDIQPEAHTRVMGLGALAFVKKPVDVDKLESILREYGIEVDAADAPGTTVAGRDQQIDMLDGYQEIANVAMGRAGDLLARLLGAFVLLPIPKVSSLAASELSMALTHIDTDRNVSAVCQGFIGSGIAGEALMTFKRSSFPDIAALLKYDRELDEGSEMELLLEIASILIAACLNSIASQLDISFSQGHPVILGRDEKIGEVVERNASRWKQTLAIELVYNIENYNISCDLLLLFTHDSLPALDERVSFLSA